MRQRQQRPRHNAEDDGEGRSQGDAREGNGRNANVGNFDFRGQFFFEHQRGAEMMHRCRDAGLHAKFIDIGGCANGSNADQGEAKVRKARNHSTHHGNQRQGPTSYRHRC